MADVRPYPDTGDDTDIGPAAGRPPATPRWVKVFAIIGIIVIVLILLVVIGRLAGLGGEHGPGRHTSPSSGRESIGGVGRPADAAKAVRTADVTILDTIALRPSRMNVLAGEMVTFVVTNTGLAAHEFTLADAAMQQAHTGEMARMGGGMAHDGLNGIGLQT